MYNHLILALSVKYALAFLGWLIVIGIAMCIALIAVWFFLYTFRVICDGIAVIEYWFTPRVQGRFASRCKPVGGLKTLRNYLIFIAYGAPLAILLLYLLIYILYSVQPHIIDTSIHPCKIDRP